MFVRIIPLLSKLGMYGLMIGFGFFAYLKGYHWGSLLIFLLGLIFVLVDWNDWRLRRFFSYDLFLDREGGRIFGIKEVKDDLVRVLELGGRVRMKISKMENEGLLGLEKEATIMEKRNLIEIYNVVDHDLKELNKLFWKYSRGGNMASEKGKLIYFIYVSTFVYLYEAGSRLSESTNFVVYLFCSESDTYKNLVRSLLFPSTQIFLRSGLYVLRKIKLRSEQYDAMRSGFVENMKYSLGVSRYPYWASLKYYFSVAKLFKRQNIIPRWRAFLLYLDKKKIRKGSVTMSDRDVEKVYRVIEPGDIVLTRKALTMTSVIIPGYWTHASLYMGSRDELREFFGLDADVIFAKLDELGLYSKGRYLVEAVEEGVVASEADKALKADSLVVFKPKVGEFDRLKALQYVLDNLSKEYDYGLDFLTESSFICSELVYKAYSDVETGEHKLGFEPTNKGGIVFTFTPQDLYESCEIGIGDRFEVGVCLKHDSGYKKVREVGLG